MRVCEELLRLLSAEWEEYNGGRYRFPLQDEKEMKKMEGIVAAWFMRTLEQSLSQSPLREEDQEQ